MNDETNTEEYGPALGYSVPVGRAESDQDYQDLAQFDTSMRTAMQRMGIPAESGKRVLQVFAQGYKTENANEAVEAEKLERWLEENPAIEKAANVVIDEMSAQMELDKVALYGRMGFDFNRARWLYSELAIHAHERGLIRD